MIEMGVNFGRKNKPGNKRCNNQHRIIIEMFHFTHWLVFAYGFRLKHLYGSSTGGGLQWKERKWRKGFSLPNYHWFTTFMDHFWCWEFQNSRKHVYTVILCNVNENRIFEHMRHIALTSSPVETYLIELCFILTVGRFPT